MRIVFGHNNFRVKAITPAEIGLIDAEYKNYMFELRQKYVHLFWIPIFPLGQIWVLRKPNGHIFDCPRDIENKLESIKPKGISIFAFAGPLLGVLILLLMPVFDSIKHAQYADSEKKYLQEKSKTLNIYLDNLESNDYLLFESSGNGSNYTNDYYPPVKVISATKDSVTLGNMFANNTSTTYNEYNTDLDNTQIAQLALEHPIVETYTIAKAKLKKALPYNTDNNKNKGIQVAQINFASNIILKNIVHAEGPILKLNKLEHSKDYTYLEFENIGFDAVADSIISDDDKLDWKLSANHDFKNKKLIALKTIKGNNAKLYCSDANKNKYIFELVNDNGHWEYDNVKIIK
jgi:hypothetical protein